MQLYVFLNTICIFDMTFHFVKLLKYLSSTNLLIQQALIYVQSNRIVAESLPLYTQQHQSIAILLQNRMGITE